MSEKYLRSLCIHQACSRSLLVIGLSLLVGNFSPAQAQLSLQGKPGICGSWNNYCNGGTVYSAPTTRTAPTQEYYTTPRGVGWYCKATATNGGWGWGESPSRSRATSYALSECSSRGRGCSLNYCSLNGGAKKAPSAGPSLRFNNSRRRTKTKRRRGTVSADLCYRKLIADVRAGRSSARRNSYVSQAIAGYENCKRKSFGSTRKGDNYARKLRKQTARARAAPSKTQRRSKRRTSTVSAAAQRKSLLKKQAAQRKRERIARQERARADLAAAPGRVVAAVERGDYKTAVSEQALVVASNKNDPKAWQEFSSYLEKSGRLDDAATAIRRAAQIGRGDASAQVSALYQRDAAAKAGKGDYKAAIVQQAMAVKAGKNDPALWRELGDYMKKDGRLDNAATALRRAYRLGGPDPEDEIFQMYQRDVLSRAKTLNSEQRIAIYRSHLEKYSDVRGNPVRQRLARELRKQKREGQAREIDLSIARFDLRDAVAQAPRAPAKKTVAAKRSTVSQLENLLRETQTALAEIKPAPTTASNDIGADLGEISTTLIDALKQMEDLQKSLNPNQPAPGQTFEVVVPTDQPKPANPETGTEKATKSAPQAPPVEGSGKTPKPDKLTIAQKRQQLAAAREQWKVIQFHYKNARQARAKAKAQSVPSMKRYYMRLAEENVSWAQGMIEKLNTTLTGQPAPDIKAARALEGRKFNPLNATEGTAYGQALHLSGQGGDGKKGTVLNLIDGTNKPIYKLPPDGRKPKVQELFGIKQPTRNAPAN